MPNSGNTQHQKPFLVSSNQNRSSTMRSRLPYRQPTGLYVHSSPPTGVPVHDSVVRQWLRGGEITRLKELVLEGDGTALVGEYSPDVTARAFLRALPRILNRIEEAHLAVASNDVERLERTIKRERAARIELSKDHSGLSLLHKAVLHGHHDLQDWLLDNYPDLVHLTDRERRSALHYAGNSPDSEEVWKRLTNAGADPTLTDISGNTPAYYMMHPRRVRPPQPRGTTVRVDTGLVIKPANIRIWIHDRDLGRLQKVVWEGYGNRLLKETSSQQTVRRFLNAVPYILGSIRDVHKAAIENDVETLKKRTEDPVPKDILLSKDSNGLNPLHKAAGLGQKEAVEEILKKAPESANARDSFGRTPLHYAAALRDPQMYDTLVEGGAVDHLQDKKGNTPSHYRSKPGDLEGSKLLSVVPEAPRTAHIFPPSWDWRLLQSAGPQIKPEVSTETILQDSTPEDITDNTQETEEISRDEAVEETRPEVSEDEGVGSENAQSVDDAASPQNGENVDMENDAVDKLDQTITLTEPVFLNELKVGPDEDEVTESQVESQPDVLDVSNDVELDDSKQEPEVQPDEEKTEPGKPPDLENDIDKNNIESISQKDKTADVHAENSAETVSEPNEQTNCNVDIENIDKEVSEAIAFLNEASDETQGLQNNEKAESKTKTVQSGRQSLKSRVKKIMMLGRSQGSLDDETRSASASRNNEKVADAVISQMKNSNHTENVINEKDKRDNESEINISTTGSAEAVEETNKTNSQENIALLDDQDVPDLRTTTPAFMDIETDDTDQKESQFSEDSLTIVKQNSEEEPTVTENNSEIFEEAELQQGNTKKEFEEDSSEDHNEKTTTPTETLSKVDDQKYEDLENNQIESTENTSKTLLSGIKRSEAERLVEAGDMDAMAEMVLAGEGEALLDLTSDNPDVQLFINNVPQYMAKIERVHKSSREGDLRGVRTSLDRRKYAVARDNATSLKPTPLHVAVLFGRTSVLRYLAGRFPETMHAQDSTGRTPLHYAATLPDNGHFYSLLITLGADKAIVDNSGNTAEYYLKNKEGLTREMLLAEYQDRAEPIDTSGLNFNKYSDKGTELLREGYPIFEAEEGQYLASSLGEPLIKGLTEVAQLRPPNPIIHLANFLLAFNKSEDTTEPIQKGIRSIEGTPVSYHPNEDENGNKMGENEEAEDEEEVVETIDDAEDIMSSPEQDESTFKPINRDEHGQSMLHFAAARSHGRNAMFQLLQEMDSNPGLRDSLYRTARDIAEHSDIKDNMRGIDRYVVSMAARGEENKLKELLLEGYDHILDTEDGGNILEIAEERGQTSIVKFLKRIKAFEENREKLHRAIRFGSLAQVQEIFKNSSSRNRLAVAKNNQGRCSLHVAVLSQHEPTVEYIANKYPATLQIGDNLLRTPLHYAMALEKVEPLSRILIASGAQRVLKDLKGRQASYYFMNKTDIKQLQEEEEVLRV